MPLAIFGIENTAVNLAVSLVVLMLVAIWIALIAFTFTDARRRISDPFLVGCATAASFFPFVGTLVYTILRPPEFLEDIHERETDIQESEVRLRHLQHNSCHKCGSPVESDFLRCPACRSRLKEPCPSCSNPVGMKWKVCPYCETTLIAPKRSSRSGSKRPKSGSTGRSSKSSRSESDRSGSSGEKTPEKRRRASRTAGSSASSSKGGEQEPTRQSSRTSSGDSSAKSSSSRSGRRRVQVSDDEPTDTINRDEN